MWRPALPMRLGLAIFGAYAMTWLFAEYHAFTNKHYGMTHPAPHERLVEVQSRGSQQSQIANPRGGVAQRSIGSPM